MNSVVTFDLVTAPDTRVAAPVELNLAYRPDARQLDLDVTPVAEGIRTTVCVTLGPAEARSLARWILTMIPPNA